MPATVEINQPFLRNDDRASNEIHILLAFDRIERLAVIMIKKDPARAVYWRRLVTAVNGWQRLAEARHKVMPDFFVQSMKHIMQCAEEVLSIYLPKKSKDQMRSALTTVQDPAQQEALLWVLGVLLVAELKMEYFSRLKDYLPTTNSPGFIPVIKNMVNNHFEKIGGKLKVNMYEHQHFEFIDPCHRNGSASDRWQLHSYYETKANRDPYDTLVDFLLRLSPNYAHQGAPYVPKKDRSFFKLLYSQNDGLTALYHCPTGKRGPRYSPDIDRVESYGAWLACRYLPYASHGASKEFGAGRSGIDDLHGGDIYVVDTDYHFYSFAPSNFHSYLLAGEGVLAAGIMVAEAGKILAIDNKSGHYQPTWKNLHQAVCELEFQNVFGQDSIVGLLLMNDALMYFTTDDFIELGNQGFTYDVTLKVLQRYFTKYHGDLPVPGSRVRLIPDAEQKYWKEPRVNGMTRWHDFLSISFSKTFQKIRTAYKKIFERIPTLEQWKKDSDAGLLASRHEKLKTIDTRIQSFQETLSKLKLKNKMEEITWKGLLPDAQIIKQALDPLQKAVAEWLEEKETKKDSTRKRAVELLQWQIQECYQNIGELRPSSNETLPMAGIDV